MIPHPDSNCPTPTELTQLLPAYEIIELVSDDEHQAIFKARQRSLDRLVTIKLLPKKVAENKKLRDVFERDAKEMAKLKHPNLVDVFDFGIIDGMLYIITELIPGRSLYETTHGNYIASNEAFDLIQNICQGLICAHTAGIIHRYLNPTNILIDEHGQAKIIDFGVPDTIKSNDDGENEFSVYHAPESFDAANEATPQMDIYSLGVIFYELLTSTPPATPYVEPSKVYGSHPCLDPIIAKAINPDTQYRYKTVQEMADDLKEVAQKIKSPLSRQARSPLLTAGNVSRPVSSPSGARPLGYKPYPVSQSKNSSAAVVIISILSVVVIGVLIAVVSSTSSTPKKKNKPSHTPTEITKHPSSHTSSKHQKKNKPTHKKSSSHQSFTKTNDTANDFDKNNDLDNELDDDNQTAIDDTDSSETNALTDNEEDKKNEETEKRESLTKKETKPATPEPPKFDVEAFLLKARNYMKGRAQRDLEHYDKDLQSNISSFERRVKRIIRKQDRKLRKKLQNQSDEVFEKLRKKGRIPEKLDLIKDKHLKKVEPYLTEALEDQKKIDQQYLVLFTESRAVYFKGLDHQINILKKEKNEEAVNLLQEEIKVTHKDMDRYIRILRGEEPDPPKEKLDKNGKPIKKKKDIKKDKK